MKKKHYALQAALVPASAKPYPYRIVITGTITAATPLAAKRAVFAAAKPRASEIPGAGHIAVNLMRRRS